MTSVSVVESRRSLTSLIPKGLWKNLLYPQELSTLCSTFDIALLLIDAQSILLFAQKGITSVKSGPTFYTWASGSDIEGDLVPRMDNKIALYCII